MENSPLKITLTDTENTSTLLKNLPLSIATFDKNMCYISASKMWIKFIGYNHESELIGKSLYSTIPEITLKFKRFHDLALAGQVIKGKNIFNLLGGKFWFRWEIHPWYKKSEVQGLLMFAENNTKENNYMQLAEKLIHELKVSNQELEKFSQLCIHDIREPIRSISNFLYIIENEIDIKSKNNTKKYFEYSKASIAQLDKLLLDLSHCSGLISSKINIHSVNLNEVVKQTKNLLSAMIIENKVKIETMNLPVILGDQTKLTSLIQNLVCNAIKYSSGPSVRVKIGYEEENDFWKIFVEDNGIGINYEYNDKIFEPFSRINDNQTTPNGTGLGLYMCKKIIEAHKGKIWFKNKIDQGSIFYFTISKKL